MKTRIALLALAIMMSSLAIANNPVKHESKTDCEKKVLMKIKRKMMFLNVKDYLVEGQRQEVIITCQVNENKQVEVVKVTGYDPEINEAIKETLQEHPVICNSTPVGEYFTFKMVLEHRPA